MRNDYDENPERFRSGRAVVRRYGTAGDAIEVVARRFAADGLGRIVDLGCGFGELARWLAGSSVEWVGADRSRTMLQDAPRRATLADVRHLPFADATFDGAAAVWMLYHLDDPREGLREAWRVLRPGGLFAAVAPSRYDSPELAPLLPPEPPATFDSEIAPAMIGELFVDVEIHAWDGPYVQLPDRAAVHAYLVGRAVDPDEIERIARAVPVPLAVTKRGAIVYGRRPR
jgi:SAM-dependent methyltransferase